MLQADNFSHTTHRTVSWFRKTFLNDDLELAAPFQRNPVWTDIQRAYLIDTILNGLPIPELYMQDVGNEEGDERTHSGRWSAARSRCTRFCPRKLFFGR